MSRYEEEDLLANLIHTYAAELSEISNLHPEEFSEPHLGELYAGIVETQNPNWDYTALLNLKLSPKARETLTHLVSNGLGNPQKVRHLAFQVKTEATLTLRTRLSDLSGSITAENKEDRLSEIKKLTAILEEPIYLDSPEDQTGRTINWLNSLQREPKYLPTNSPALNEFIDGFSQGRLYVLAARPAMGKTAVALNFLWGLRGKANLVFYSLEMTETEILSRLASIETGLPNNLIKAKADQSTNEILVRNFLPVLETSGVEIVCPKEGFTMPQLRAEALKRKQSGKLDFLVIDQLDKIRPGGKLASATEYEILTRHSTQLKQLALELDVPVLVLCQINREGNEEPQLKNLKGSGQLEQDADLVFILHSPAEAGERTELSLRIAKNRHGRTGKIFYGWQGNQLRITEPKNFDGYTLTQATEIRRTEIPTQFF